ncbi:MAG TPA: trypsin-like peptidase domain-containing protein [Candidatus Saccharimonadales bacterium]|nr:trypsin-like peptidase domain-containing protein [Candidatus Saccharimonadales bacterium]
MFGFNWIDAIIVLLVVGSVWAGLRLGLFRQFCLMAGFFGGLFVAGGLLPHMLPLHDRTQLTVINGSLVLIVASYLGIRSYKFSSYWQAKLQLNPQELPWEVELGVILSLASVLISVWLATAAIGRLPFSSLSTATNDARLVLALNHHLPAAPAVFGTFNHLINPNDPTHLIIQTQPYISQNVRISTTKKAVVVPATVKLTGLGCGGVITGSGFVVGPHLVMTAAHVIAGVEQPLVKIANHNYTAEPVLFNAKHDVALLRVPNLNTPPLSLLSGDAAPGQAIYSTGYPNGAYALVLGSLSRELQARARTIYDVGVVNEMVYDIQATIQPGLSGSPVMLADGRVIGMVITRSDKVPSHGYALTSSSLLQLVQQAQQSQRRVSTGVCLR